MRTVTNTGENAPTGDVEGNRRTGALSGVLAAGLTIGVGQLAAGIVSPSTGPLVVVGDAVVDAVPAWLKDAAIRTFGVHDKVVLLTTIAVVVALLAALAGILARRRLALGVGIVAVLGVVGLVAAATRPDATALSPLPSALGAAAGVYALVVLTRRLARRRAQGPGERAPGRGAADGPARRGVLLGGTAAAALASGGIGQLLVDTRSAEQSRGRVVLPEPADPAPALPDGVDPADAIASGLTAYATTSADFYRIDTALVVPDVTTEDWSLRVHGLVDTELTLDFATLLAKPLRERWITLTCVSNEVGGTYIGNARWLGYPLKDLLAEVGVGADADMLYATSTDGFTLSAPLAEATDGRDAMLVVGMNGQALPREHGFPVRMVIPGLYGYVSACKWITDLEVTRFADKTAYWTDRGWAAKGPIKTASRIDVPKSFAKVRAGRVPVAGVAWAQHRGISKVEVRVDEGEWAAATVVPSVSSDTWCQWVYDWDASESGEHSLQVRATDGDGTPQTDVVAAPVPDGASGYDSVTVTVQ